MSVNDDEDGDGDGVTVGELKDLNDFAFKPWQDLLEKRNRIKSVGKKLSRFFFKYCKNAKFK